MLDDEPSRTWTRRAASPLLALALHVAAGWILWRTAPSPRPTETPTRDERSREEVTVDLVVDHATDEQGERRALAAPDPQPGSATEAPAARAPRAERAVAAPSARESPSDPGDEAADGAPAATSEAPEQRLSFVRPAAPPDIGIGLGGVNRFAPRREEPPSPAEGKRDASQILRHSGWERDRELGLGPEGPVLTALADGTSRSVAPVRGRAVFVAKTGASGEVVSLELLETEGDRAGWADARRLALAALAGKKLRVPTTARGVSMKIEVVSAWKLPSGQDPGTNVSVFHVPLSKGEGKDSAKVSILEPKIGVEHIEIAPGVKIPVPTVQLTIFGTNADPTNIGAKPRRIIHTHLIDSTVM